MVFPRKADEQGYTVRRPKPLSVIGAYDQNRSIEEFVLFQEGHQLPNVIIKVENRIIIELGHPFLVLLQSFRENSVMSSETGSMRSHQVNVAEERFRLRVNEVEKFFHSLGVSSEGAVTLGGFFEGLVHGSSPL